MSDIMELYAKGITITCKCGKTIEMSCCNGCSTIKRNNFDLFRCSKCGSTLGIRRDKEPDEPIFGFVMLGDNS